MGSIAEINVRIGARIDSMVKGLNKAERRLQRSSRKMAQLGSDMTKMISLPIIGIGAAAIKSAGDMEQLENGLASIMGDAGAAATELEKLKEAAKNPGLGFTQAVKGSVRLQSVGLGAETARKALLNFGNAIALAGGSATDLDGVSLALTQIISKGKISAEEINQLAERVPQVRKAIKDGFGTADSEELQKLGVSAEDFVEKVINEMGKLPKATGGIKNAITNAGIAIQVFLSDLGKDIDQTFDVQGMVKNFSDTLSNLADRFKALDASTKKTVLQFAAFVVAIGPAIKVMATLKNVYAGVISTSAMMLKGFKNMSGVVLNAAVSFQKLNLVMKASVIGATIAAVTAAVVIFKKWNNTLSESQKVQLAISDVSTKAAQSIVEEKLQVQKLTSVLKNENATREEKKAALNELNRISPQYFGGLDTEKSKIEDVTKAMDSYISNLQRMARVQAAKDKIIELNKALLDNESALDKNQVEWHNWEAIQIRMTKFGENRNKALAQLWGNQTNDYKASLQNQIDELAKFAAGEEMILDKRSKNISKVTDTKTPQFKKATKEKKTKKDKIEVVDIQSLQEQNVAQEALFSSLVSNLIETETYQKRLKEQQDATKLSTDNFLAGVAMSPEHFAKAQAGIESLRVELEQMQAEEDRFNSMMESAKAAGDAIQSYAQQGGDSLKALGKTALKSAADFVRAEMMKATAAFISSRIALGPLGLLLAGTGAAVVGTLFNKALGALKVPALAEGGLATGPTLAMVGDNRGAGAGNPEVIAPLNKLKGMLVSQTPSFSISHRIDGNDLLVVVENANNNRQRTSGNPAFATS